VAYESLQKQLNRARPPQVHITYDVELGGAIEKRALPFVIGVLADLSGSPADPLPRLRERKFVEIDRNNFDAAIERCRPRLELRVPLTLEERDSAELELPVTLTFRSLTDFSPEAIAAQIPALNALLAARDVLSNVSSVLFGNDRLEERLQSILINPTDVETTLRDLRAMQNPLNPAQPGQLANELLDCARVRKSAEDRASAAAWLGDFLEQAARGDLVISRDTESIISARLAVIDHYITRQLDEVMHHPDFQRLESTWRSVWYLVDQVETSVALKIRILNASSKDLLRDFRTAADFDQTVLFRKIYEEEYGTMGGTPFALLIGDYYISRERPDITLLTYMTQIGAAAHVPFVAGVSPSMFNLENFTELTLPRDLGKIFDSAEYAAWRSFRQSTDARFSGLTLPRMLLRLPYATDTNPIERFRYEERVDNHEHYLWGNSAFALGVRIADSFARFGWYSQIRGVEGGGLIAGLPAHSTVNDDGEMVLQCPTEIAITDRRELEIARLGFIPLLHVKNSDNAVFFSVRSCCKPKAYDQDDLNAAEVASAGLDCVLAISRFTHYLRCLMRDKIGSFQSAADSEQYLNDWLKTYVQSDSTTRPDAKTPLKHGKIELTEVPGHPGAYRATLEIQPAFQFENISRPLRAIVMLPQSFR
jgi:type VI secretion system protein ImpC